MRAVEPNAIVQIGNGSFTEPNVRATEQEIYNGLEASSQNCWPSVEFDIGGINNFISPIIRWIHYKTLLWPKKPYMNVSGLGKSPTHHDPELYDHNHIHCDVLVIGGRFRE